MEDDIYMHGFRNLLITGFSFSLDNLISTVARNGLIPNKNTKCIGVPDFVEVNLMDRDYIKLRPSDVCSLGIWGSDIHSLQSISG